MRELGLTRRGYRVSVVTPDYFVPFPDGSGLTLWGDTARDAAEIAKFSTADATAYVEFDRYFARVARLLALSELPRPTGWDSARAEPLHRGLMAISPSVEYLERAWDDAKYGRPSRQPYIEMVFPTAHEPGLAPEGSHIALAFSQYGPYHLAAGSWDTERDAYARRVLDTLEEYCPGIAASVLHSEVLAPPDIETRYGLLGGNIFQGEMNPDQMFSLRPIFGYGDYRTPISGLYLCGSGTHPGGGVMAAPARNASRVILADIRRERLRTRLRPAARRAGRRA